jgi:hypothetical protein
MTKNLARLAGVLADILTEHVTALTVLSSTDNIGRHTCVYTEVTPTSATRCTQGNILCNTKNS